MMTAFDGYGKWTVNYFLSRRFCCRVRWLHNVGDAQVGMTQVRAFLLVTLACLLQWGPGTVSFHTI
jgi:hypothetical protein